MAASGPKLTRAESPGAEVVPDVLVGRSSDCAVLDDLVEAIGRGLSRTLVIVGEPGIGKTCLLRYAARAAGGLRRVAPHAGAVP